MDKTSLYWLMMMLALTLGGTIAGCSGADRGQGAEEPVAASETPAPTEPAAEPAAVTYRNIELHLVATDGGDTTESWCGEEPAVLDPEVVVSGDDIESLRQETLPDGAEALIVHLNDGGSQRLADVTSANVDRRLAIVVDGRVVMSPVIREAITGGVAQITGCDGLSVEQMLQRITGGETSATAAPAETP